MPLFKEVDDIIRLGKWVYLEIPTGGRCKGCPLLSQIKGLAYEGWQCALRPSYGLMHNEGGPLKDDNCPRKEGV